MTDYKTLKNEIVFRLEENPPRLQTCLQLITEDQVWQAPNSASNAIANLVLHLMGNCKQYIHSSLGNQTDLRQRDEEFQRTEGLSKAELLHQFEHVISSACEIIQSTNPQELERTRTVQGFSMSGIGCMVHVCEHMSYHMGQIALITKLFGNQDLGFYAGVDLSVTNQNS
jgi:uncharacterized damage-inducible protein DinB